MWMLHELSAQSKLGVEYYHYLNQSEGAAVPLVNFTTGRHWRGEVRYNYEDVHTLSLFAGRTIKGGEKLAYKFAPMIGYSFGRFKGMSLAANTDLEWKKIYFSSQTQYTRSTKGDGYHFFFNWSEAGYEVCEYFILAGLSFGDLSIPFYAFRKADGEKYFILGLNYEFSLKSKKQN
jgi:hypothetical protein